MSNPEQGNLGWMYKGGDNTVDREEYLLGRAVDKAFECSEFGLNGQNEIEKSCLPQSIFESAGCNTQVDILRKKQEDPLEVIRQKEIEVRKQLLKNPIKLRKLQKQLKEQSHSKEKSMKKKKKKKREDGTPNSDDDDLDKKLAEKYLKLIKKYGLEKLKNINDKSSSEYESSSEEEKKIRKKDVKYKHNKSSDESSPLEGSSRARGYKDKRRDPHRSYKQRNRDCVSTSDSDRISSENELSKTSSRNNHYNENKRHSFQGDRHLNKTKDHNSKRYHHYSSHENSLGDTKRETNIKSKKGEMEEKGHFNRNYGLVVPENAPKPKKHSENIELKTEKSNKIETSTRKRPSKLNLSEDEKEKRRREMMQNAKWRDEVRNKNVKRYKKEEEEEQKKEKNYDSDFLRKQIADVISVHESVGERIRSNINNIQRTSIALDKKFTSK